MNIKDLTPNSYTIDTPTTGVLNVKDLPTNSYTVSTPNFLQKSLSNAVSAVKSTVAGVVNTFTQPIQATYNPIEIGNAIQNAYTTSLKDTGDKISTTFEDWKKNNPIQNAVNVGESGLGIVNTLLAPIFAGPLAGAEKIPGVSLVARGINSIFAGIGAGSSQVGVNALNDLPISDETKKTLTPLVRDASGLAGMIIAGKTGFMDIDNFVGKNKTIVDTLQREMNTPPPPEMKSEIAPVPPTSPTMPPVESKVESEANPLLQEAKKYKSAEEFVKAQEVKPETPATAINKTSYDIISKSVKEDIIKQGDIQTHEVQKVDDWVKNATDILSQDPERVTRIAMGEEIAPKETPASVFYRVAEKNAIENKGVPTILKLNESKIGVEAGRNVNGFDVFNENSPLDRIKEVQRAVEKRTAKTAVKPESIVKEAKTAMDNVPRETLLTKLSDYVDKITC